MIIAHCTFDFYMSKYKYKRVTQPLIFWSGLSTFDASSFRKGDVSDLHHHSSPVFFFWREACFLMGETIEDDETGAGAVALEVASSQPAPQSCLHQEEGVSCCLSVPSLKKGQKIWHLHSSVSHRRLQVRQPPHDIPHYLDPTDWTAVIYSGQRMRFYFAEVSAWAPDVRQLWGNRQSELKELARAPSWRSKALRQTVLWSEPEKVRVLLSFDSSEK